MSHTTSDSPATAASAAASPDVSQRRGNARGQKVLVALPTAFLADGSLDLEGSKAAAALVAASKADGAFVAGTTGEFPALEPEERTALFAAVREALGSKRLVGHIGAGSLRQSLRALEDAKAVGITEFAALTPYYLPSSPTATYDYFKGLSDASDGVRIYVYLFEARSTTPVTPAELAELAKLPGLVGAKLSGVSLEKAIEYRAATPDDFEIFTGNDADFPVVGENGLDGVVSGVSSVFPESFDRMISALASGDADAISAAHSEVLDVVTVIAGDIARIKTGLIERGVEAGTVRMAIEAPDADARAEISRAIAAYAH